MHEAQVSAALPFPLRVGEGPYSITLGDINCLLTVERCQHKHFDERINIAQGDLDLRFDRAGWASYSLVRARLESSTPIADPVSSFIDALNILIEQVRDLFGVYWIRPLEQVDLFQLSVASGSTKQVHMVSTGRAGGITLPVVGLKDEAVQRLHSRLDAGRRPPTWRLIQLDAHEARATGRYEEAVVLGWTALEAACKQNLPHLAAREGLSLADLKACLGARRRNKEPFLSNEEVVRWASAPKCVGVTADLMPAQPYAPGSLAVSVLDAYEIRNDVVHRGARITKAIADRALEAVDFVLRALALDHLPPPTDEPLKSWRQHFGQVHRQLERWAAGYSGRVILFNAARANPDRYIEEWWDLRVAGNDYLVYLQPDVPEAIAATLLVLSNEVFTYQNMGSVPALRVTSGGKELLIAGLLIALADTTTRAVIRAKVLLGWRGRGLPVVATSKYAIQQILERGKLWGLNFDCDDVRYSTLPAELASYFAVLSSSDRKRFVEKLAGQNAGLAARAAAWAEILHSVGYEDDHAICDTLRYFHEELGWLDSIVVDCPVENASFGSRKWPFGKPD
jgi:hypothetical protein